MVICFPAGVGDLSLLKNVQKASAAHPASYEMSNGVSFFGVKAVEA
jgi:hypothetical protein